MLGEVFRGPFLQGDFLDVFDLRFLDDFQDVFSGHLDGRDQRSMTIT